MLFTSVLALTALVCSVVAAPAAAPAKPTEYRIKVLSAAPGNNPAFDKDVQGYYVVPSKGFSGNNVGQGTIDEHAWDKFTLIDDDTKLKFGNGQSLVLNPLSQGGHSATTQFQAGAKHNELKAVPYRGTHLIVGTAKNFDSWIICETQYGPVLEWTDHSYDLAAANKGSPFICGYVVLQANVVGSPN